MLKRKQTKFGVLTFNPTWAERHEDTFDTVDTANDVLVSSVVGQLDGLLEQRRALVTLEGEAFNEAYERYLNYQSKIIALLSPILDRLANAGSLYLIFDPDAGHAKEHRKIGFESAFGYSIVRGYAVVGTRLDEVSEVPPVLEVAD